jgi:hypothetical protein
MSDSALAGLETLLSNAGDIALGGLETVSGSMLGSWREGRVTLRGSSLGVSPLVLGTLREAAKVLSTVRVKQSHGSRSMSASWKNMAYVSEDCHADWANRRPAGSRVLPLLDSVRLLLRKR